MNYKSFLYLFALLFLSACISSGSNSAVKSTARQTSEINTSLGNEYLRRGKLEIALEKLKKAITADPTYAPAHTVIAVLYEQIGEQRLAGKHYSEAVKLSPDNGDVNNNYGVFLCKSGKETSAEKYFLKAVDDPFYRTPEVAYANAGSCALQSENLDKAERYLRQSLEYDAEFTDALFALAKLSFKQGEDFQARAFLQRFESSAAVTAESLSLGSRIETSRQNNQGAEQYRNQLLLQFPNSAQAEKARNKLN